MLNHHQHLICFYINFNIPELNLKNLFRIIGGTPPTKNLTAVLDSTFRSSPTQIQKSNNVVSTRTIVWALDSYSLNNFDLKGYAYHNLRTTALSGKEYYPLHFFIIIYNIIIYSIIINYNTFC